MATAEDHEMAKLEKKKRRSAAKLAAAAAAVLPDVSTMPSDSAGTAMKKKKKKKKLPETESDGPTMPKAEIHGSQVPGKEGKKTKKRKISDPSDTMNGDIAAPADIIEKKKKTALPKVCSRLARSYSCKSTV